MKWGFGAALLLVVAGCAPQLPTVRPDGEAAAFGETPGEAAFVVRTLAATPDGIDREVGGVGCVALADDYRVEFRAPARVVVPAAAPYAQPVRVRCAGGGRSGEAVAVPRPVYGYEGARVWPSLGVSVGTGGRVGVGLGAHVSPVPVARGTTYDDVRVVLR